MIADPTNWLAVKSVCPGVLKDIDEDTLAECVKQVRTEYEKEWDGVDLSPTRGVHLKKAVKGKAS
jgi:hypothetical protein